MQTMLVEKVMAIKLVIQGTIAGKKRSVPGAARTKAMVAPIPAAIILISDKFDISGFAIPIHKGKENLTCSTAQKKERGNNNPPFQTPHNVTAIYLWLH